MNSISLKVKTIDEFNRMVANMQPPYNPFDIAKSMGIDVKQNIDWDKIAYDGEIYLNESNQPEIWINPTNPSNRQNFTLAHEIGHLYNDVLPNISLFKDPIRDDYTTLRRDGAKNASEIKANIFASNLLMPKEDISDIGSKTLEDFRKEHGEDAKMNIGTFIKLMSNKFEVSESAMKWRLVNLGLINK